MTAQNVARLILPAEQVSAAGLLQLETDRSFMGRVWICARTGVYQTRGAKSVGVVSRTRDRSTYHGGKLTLARTPEAGKFHHGQVGHLEIRARPASREYTLEKLLPRNVY